MENKAFSKIIIIVIICIVLVGYGAVAYFLLSKKGTTPTKIGVSWEYFENSPKGITSIMVINEDVFLVGSNYSGEGLWKSIDGGKTWIKDSYWDSLLVSGPGAKVKMSDFPTSFAADPQNPQIIYTTSLSNGIYKSLDKGETWAPINKGVKLPLYTSYLEGGEVKFRKEYGKEGEIGMTQIVVSPSEPNVLYAIGGDKYIFKSSNYGKNWELLNEEKPMYMGSLVVHPDDSEIIFSGDSDLYKSNNGGKTWQEMKLPDLKIIEYGSLIVNHLNPDMLYIVTRGDGVYKSTDGGKSWKSIFEGKWATGLVMESSNPNNLYLGTELEGIFISNDGGENWKAANNGLTGKGEDHFLFPIINTLYWDENSKTIYAGTSQGVFRYSK